MKEKIGIKLFIAVYQIVVIFGKNISHNLPYSIAK